MPEIIQNVISKATSQLKMMKKNGSKIGSSNKREKLYERQILNLMNSTGLMTNDIESGMEHEKKRSEQNIQGYLSNNELT